MPFPAFYPVVDSAAWVERVVQAGARLVQLRMKNRPDEVLRNAIHESQRLCNAHGAQLVVNDDWQMALDAGCTFVHLGQEDLAKADLPRLRAAGLRIGISTHSDEELETALRARPAYVALGPIYPTLLKKMPWAPQGLERIALWKQRVGALPLIAIGGITLERAPGCWAAGADSVAVVSDVVSHADPESRVRAYLAMAPR